MSNIFNVFFYQPLFNLLVLIYNFIPGRDIGVAIIVLTVLIKFILYPLSLQSLKSQKALQDLQPKINELKNKYKNQKDKLASETMNLYKQEKVSPFSSCLPLLIQFPFLIAIFWVFKNGLINGSLEMVYPFIYRPENINPIAFGFLDLAKSNLVLSILAGLSQFWQTKMLAQKKPEIKSSGAKDEAMMTMMNQQMTYFMPIITVIIGMSLPGGLMLYWMTNSLFTVAQQFLAFKKKKTKTPEVVVVKEIK